MPSDKPSWRKFTHWLSPLLAVSLGLHGLVMLIPLPDRDEPVEVSDADLPEPIPVTELPQSAELLPKNADMPMPMPDIIAPSAPLAEPAVQPPPAIVAPVPTPTPTPKPTSTFTPTPTPGPAPTPTPGPTPTPTPTSGPTPTPIAGQPYSAQGTTSKDRQNASLAFAIRNNSLIAQNIRTPLSLSYPAAGRCFKETTSPTAVVAFVINRFSDILDAAVIRKTGYKGIDDWLYDAVSDPDDPTGVMSAVRTSYSGETGKALGPEGDATQAAFEFEVAIAIEGSVCE